MKRGTKRILLSIIGLLLSTVPVSLAAFSYFPLWIEKGSSYAFSGILLFLLLLASLPSLRLLKRLLSSPSVWLLWFIVFLLFYTLSKIADEVTVIAFIGFISNALGALFFKIGERYERRDNE